MIQGPQELLQYSKSERYDLVQLQDTLLECRSLLSAQTHAGQERRRVSKIRDRHSLRIPQRFRTRALFSRNTEI